MTWTLLVGLSACTGGGETLDTAPEATVTPYIYEQDEPVAPALSPAEVELAATEVLASLLELNAAPIVDAYFLAMAGQQGDCPDYYQNDGNVYWYDYCYADDGSYFSGYGFGYLYEDTAADGYLYNGGAVYTVAEVTTSQGYTFSGGGNAQALVATADMESGAHAVPHTIYSSVVSGAFAYDGPSAAGTWLESALTPDLTLYSYRIPENEIYPGYYGTVMQANGGVGGFVGEVSAAVLDSFTVMTSPLTACPVEPAGMLSVRDTEGVWYDILFDNTTEEGETMDPDLCDGCGTIYVQGEAAGEACVDTSVLTAWEVSPW
ncbi:MAG: hypothetical protein VX899_19015 [Myxococcota bacterium]|nr:hypothetical protein [Myxococcota bacterium]